MSKRTVLFASSTNGKLVPLLRKLVKDNMRTFLDANGGNAVMASRKEDMEAFPVRTNQVDVPLCSPIFPTLSLPPLQM